MSASALFRIFVLALWLTSSLGGLTYALTHFFSSRDSLRREVWEGTPDEDSATVHRLLARVFIGYFAFVVITGLGALLWPAPLQPLRPSVVFNTMNLIASNGTNVFGVFVLRRFAKKQRQLAG